MALPLDTDGSFFIYVLKLRKFQPVSSIMNKFLSSMIGSRQTTVDPPQPATGVVSVPAPKGVQFMPGEDVLLLAITLPKMSATQRRIAAAFAVEDRIARPLEEVHVAIGPETAPDQWLICVVARAVLRVDARTSKRLLPDTLALPVPTIGHWAVWQENARVLVRLPDGTGFVTNPDALPLLHQMGGAPIITLYAGHIALAHRTAPLPPLALPQKFDLRDRQDRVFKVPALARRLANIAIIAALGHLAILSVDTIYLSRQQTTLITRLRTAVGAAQDVRIDDLLARILAPPPSAPEMGFLPLLATTFAAIADQTGRVTLRDLRYTSADRRLALTVQAPDLGTLQQVETNLGAASLAVTAGPATNANGTAEQQLTVQGPPA